MTSCRQGLIAAAYETFTIAKRMQWAKSSCLRNCHEVLLLCHVSFIYSVAVSWRLRFCYRLSAPLAASGW
jgi:hypothetical protein